MMSHSKGGRSAITKRAKRRRWGNRTGDLKVLNFTSQKWSACNGVTDEDTGYRGVEDSTVENRDLVRTPTMASDPGTGRRTKDAFAREVNHRGMMKSLYSGYVKLDRLERSMAKHLKGANGLQLVDSEDVSFTTSYSLLQYAETRLDVALWRAGLAKTRPQAHQLCAHGHVVVTFPGKAPWTIKQPSCQLKPLTIVQVKPSVWCGIAESVMDYWRNPLNERLIPAYLSVDREKGKLVLNHFPLDGEVRRPSTMSVSVKSRRK
jgi:ribosomal protein S4